MCSTWPKICCTHSDKSKVHATTMYRKQCSYKLNSILSICSKFLQFHRIVSGQPDLTTTPTNKPPIALRHQICATLMLSSWLRISRRSKLYRSCNLPTLETLQPAFGHTDKCPGASVYFLYLLILSLNFPSLTLTQSLTNCFSPSGISYCTALLRMFISFLSTYLSIHFGCLWSTVVVLIHFIDPFIVTNRPRNYSSWKGSCINCSWCSLLYLPCIKQ